MGGGDGGASDAAPASSSAASSIELKVPGRGICDLKTVRSRLCHINKNLHTCINRQRLLHLCSGRTMPSMVTQRLMQVRGLGGCKP